MSLTFSDINICNSTANEWLILMYIMEEDKNLVSPFNYAVSNLSTYFKSAGIDSSASNINLCILKRANNHYGSYKMIINKGEIVSKFMTNIGYITPTTYGDVDMLDPFVLYNFIKEGMKTCPSKKTALFMQCHSNAWYLKQDMNESRIRAYAEIFHPLIVENFKFNILCITSCFVSTIELAYEVRNLANYLIAHEIGSPILPMWSSTTMFAFSNPSYSDKDICFQIVEDYMFHSNLSSIEDKQDEMKVKTDIAVIDLANLDSFVNYLSSLNLQSISKKGLLASRPDPDNYEKYPTIYMCHDIYTAVKEGLNLSQQDFNEFETKFDQVVVKYIQNKKLKKEKWSNILNGFAYVPCPWKHEKNGYTYKSLEFYKFSDKFINCDLFLSS